ncbi:MAG: HAD hydrolase-like protein [Aeromicrobium sp.]|uniref:HAD hydrolase-like protein n=1 Tax=Aeromicrobium sp. TaxID=1871063 RepID=UPI0039E5E38B
MLDLDGVVYVGPEAVPGAAESLQGLSVAYLTNNAYRTADQVAAHLIDLGMPCRGAEDVVTSAQAVARMMADALPEGAAVLVVGGPGLREPLSARGLRLVDTAEEAVAVVQGHSPETGWPQLAEACYAIHAGARWFASNLDQTFPSARGIAPGNGSMVQAVANATGRWPEVAGKPERPLFEESLARTGAERPIMVGDRPDTDIDGAIGADVDSLAVLTGVATIDDLAALPAGRRPSFVGADLSALHVPHPPVEVVGQTARCGEATATVTEEQIVVDADDPQRVEALRARLALAWARMDS